ncbi:MAG: glycosyltransferase family 2 protein [Patescibacteria group bacterium]
MELSVIIPCLNEEQTIDVCIKKALKSIKTLKIQGEVIVSDNGSVDKSREIAKKAGALVIRTKEKGYGNALKKGFNQATGQYMIMGDGDDTYDFSEIPKFYKKLKDGNDFVIGDRHRKGKIEKGATPLSHRIGVPVLTFILNHFYNIRISDSQCGMRGITKESYKRLNLQTTGMEFASEMIIKASKLKLKIAEVPITLYPRRGSEAKLHTFKDGWRHLSFMLTQGTNYMFIYPGLLIFLFGVLIFILLAPGQFEIFGRVLHYHVLYIASMITIAGYNILIFGLLTKQYSSIEEFTKPDWITRFVKKLTLEKILSFGLLILFISILLFIYTYIKWSQNHFGALLESGHLILGLTLFILSIQTIFSGFFSKIIELKK